MTAGGGPRGAVLRGTVWRGGDAEPEPDAVVVLDGDGVVRRIGPRASVDVPPDLPVLGGDGCWIGPALADTHVHLAFAEPVDVARGGVAAVRDLGGDLAELRRQRETAGLMVASSGPLLTAPGGYPADCWGPPPLSLAIGSPDDARQAVRRLVDAGVDVVKVALESRGGTLPLPGPGVVRVVVEAAHDAGLGVVAHALRADAVARAVAAGVDELAHVPVDPLPPDLVEQLADRGIRVCSTLQALCIDGHARQVLTVAATLHAGGVELVHGSDLGNAGTRPGADSRELERLAAAGMGRLGALRAATTGAARSAGLRDRLPEGWGLVHEGVAAPLVVLPGDPLVEPAVWDAPLATIVDGHVHRPAR